MATRLSSCPPKPELQRRKLLTRNQAEELGEIFKILAGDTRLIMLHALSKNDELTVTELADAVGLGPQAVSNQLQRLVDKGIVDRRRNGVQMLYRIIDPCVINLLEQGLCLSEDARTRRRQ